MDKLFGKIKDKAKSVKQSVADWWAPSADEVRVRDVAREVPGATAKTIGDIIRSVPRAILSTALTVSPKKTKEVIGDINPEEDFGKTGKFLLGDERIKTIPMMGKETLEGFGVSEEKAKTYGPLAGIGLTALDLYPGTSGKGKGVSLGVKELKTLRTLKEAPEVFKVLTKAGIDESVAKEVAGDIAKTTKTGQIREILGGKGITLAGEGKTAVKGVSRETDDLTIEASKYKSADEFAKAQGLDFQYENIEGEKRIIIDLWPKESIKGKGITKNELLSNLKKAYINGNKIIEPSNGIWTKEGYSFINKIKEDGFIKPTENRGGIVRYEITPKVKEYQTKSQLTDIWNKANRSVKVSRETAPKDTDFVYHTTSEKAVEKIKNEGLKPSKDGQYGPGVYFAPSEAKTGGYGSAEGAMLRVNRKKLPEDFQEWPGEQGWTEKGIPPEAIEIKQADGSWKTLKEVSGETQAPKIEYNTRGMQANYGNLAEAMYRTPDEIKVYRGSGKGIGNSTFVDGQYWADSRKFAETFGDVKEGSIPKNAEIFDFDIVKNNPDQKIIPKELLVDNAKLTEWLLDRGIKYTKNTNSRGVEFVKLNKTASDLKKLARSSDSLSDFKKKVTDNWDKYKEEINRMSAGYTEADWSRMRSPMEDIWNKVARETPEVDLPPSVGDILKGRGDDIVPPKSMERPPLKPKKDERRFITRTRALEPNLDEYLKGAKDTRSTEELVQRADELIKTNLDEAKNIAKTQTDDFAVAVASRLIDKKVLEARAIKDIGRKNELWDEVAEIANETARNLTEHGRAIQASIILGRMTPEGMVRFASRQIQKHNQMVDQLKNNPLKKTLSDMFSGQGMRKSLKKIPELDGKEAQEIADEMEKITKIADEVERARAFQKLNEKIASRIPSSLYEKIVTVWKAGLLTGVKTSGLNILSNISHSASEVIKDVPGALVDRIVSIFTGKRALVATTKGLGKGAKTGVAKGWDYLKTGFDERDIGTKLDYRKVNFGKSKLAKAIQTYEESVFRLLGSEDQPFYYGAKARSLYSQAIAKAKNAGLKGKEAKTFIDNLVENPTDDMIKYATLDAETAVFQNKTTLGQMAKAVQNLPGGQIVLPFGKTPSAVATQILNYSPVGIVKTIAKNVGKGKFDQRLFSQGLGRGLTGTAVLWLGTQLFNNDMVSTSYPISEKERKQWELEGRQANSIKINGKWRNAGVLGPAGLLLVIGGHMQEGINDTGSFTGGLAQASGGVGSTLTDQTFLRGINQTIEAIQDPQRSFSGWASSLAGSIIPTLVADISRSTDRYERRAPTPATRIASRLPGTRQTLEPKVDTFGKEIETPDFFTAMFDPTRPTQPTADANDPVVRELKRLREAGYPATPTQLGPNKGYESLTPEENTYLYQISGRYARRAIEDIIETSAYKGADDEMKEKLIGDAVNRSRVESRARALLRFTRGLRGRELAEKIRNLRDEKLVTDSVYGYYLKLKQ